MSSSLNLRTIGTFPRVADRDRADFWAGGAGAAPRAIASAVGLGVMIQRDSTQCQIYAIQRNVIQLKTKQPNQISIKTKVMDCDRSGHFLTQGRDPNRPGAKFVPPSVAELYKDSQKLHKVFCFPKGGFDRDSGLRIGLVTVKNGAFCLIPNLVQSPRS